MTSNDPQHEGAVLPRLLELPWWAYAVILLIALVGALVLHYLNATKFPLIGTSTAVIVYLATTWSLAAAYARFADDSDSRLMQSEVVGGVLLVMFGAIAGGIGGAIWWLSVGPEVATISQAIIGGAVLGALVIGFLLGGA